jgi:hypothetical protein
MSTGVVALTSDLKRKKWMREGLVQAASKSFWNTYTGTTKDSIVFQANNATAGDGHTVVFDFDGNLSGKAIKGKNTAYGKGETKRKFSDKITVERYRLPVNNGDAFDAVDIGDLSISQHGDSRTKLGDLFVRFKDQALFDAAQGALGQAPTHTIDLGASFTYADLQNIEKVLKTSNGYTTGGVRRPLDPMRVNGGQKPIWLFVIDSAMKTILMQDTAAVNGFAAIMANADVRGNNNRMISSIIGQVGNLLIVEADQFFGVTAGTTLGWGLDDSEIEISGLRQYAGADPLTAPWTGQSTFDYTHANLHSRGIILGAGALQLAFGKQPDYRFQESQDFAIESESAVEFWMESRKTKLVAENTDYTAAKISNIDYGVIAVDLEVQ